MARIDFIHSNIDIKRAALVALGTAIKFKKLAHIDQVDTSIFKKTYGFPITSKQVSLLFRSKRHFVDRLLRFCENELDCDFDFVTGKQFLEKCERVYGWDTSYALTSIYTHNGVPGVSLVQYLGIEEEYTEIDKKVTRELLDSIRDETYEELSPFRKIYNFIEKQQHFPTYKEMRHSIGLTRNFIKEKSTQYGVSRLLYFNAWFVSECDKEGSRVPLKHAKHGIQQID